MLQTFVMSKIYYINGQSPKGLELLFKFQWKLVVWWLHFMNLLTDLFGNFFFTNTSSRLLCVVYKYIVGCRNYYQCFILRLSTILNYLNIANDFVRTVWPKREQRVVDHLPLLTYGIKLSLEAWILESKNSNLNFK